jgi:hypothetical protein
VLFYEIGDDLLVGFKSFDGSRFVVLHEVTVTGYISAEDGG